MGNAEEWGREGQGGQTTKDMDEAVRAVFVPCLR